MQEIHRNQGIKVISRAVRILRVLGEDTDGLSLGQIANRVELPRSTVQRIVGALSLEGLVSNGRGHGAIRLGPELHSLAQASLTVLSERLKPVMRSISEETGETVDLAVLENRKMLFIDQVVGSQRLRTVSSIGEAFPLTITANGKAALSCLDQTGAIKLILSEFKEQNRTGAPVSGLLTEIESIRRGTLAIDENEHTEGICALGFPIRDPNGDILAISVPVPSSRYARTRDRLNDVLLGWRDEVAAWP